MVFTSLPQKKTTAIHSKDTVYLVYSSIATTKHKTSIEVGIDPSQDKDLTISEWF